MIPRNTALAIVSSPLLLLTTSACRSGDRTEPRTIDVLPLVYYEGGGPSGGYRLDAMKFLHLESRAGYSNSRVFPFASQVVFESERERRIRELFGIEYLLPLWQRERDEDRFRFRLVAIFGFDYLSLARYQSAMDYPDTGGERLDSEWTVLPYVGNGNSIFRVRSSELEYAPDAGATLAVDFCRILWDSGFQALRYRSSDPYPSAVPGTASSPQSRTLDLCRMFGGVLTLLRDHEITGAETDIRVIGFFEADSLASSLFRVRARKDPGVDVESYRVELIGPLVRWESAPDFARLWIFPLFTYRREGDAKVLRLAHLLPIRW